MASPYPVSSKLTLNSNRSVIEASSGPTPILQSAQTSLKFLVRRPHHFLGSRAYCVTLLLYGSTYFTSNTIDTFYSSNSCSQGSPRQSNGLVKFGAVSAVNITLSLYKDSQFARLFGAGSGRALPLATFMLLSVRDGMTIFASFNLPSSIAPLLPESLDNTISRLSVAQLIVPALMQPANTPLHLLGLDLYNRNERLAVRERMGTIWRKWRPASVARMSRVVMPFGVGNVVNRRFRDTLNS
jgi:hypothetical protein